jgi:uncharacterized protein YbcC (UPF0753/DUF2309 family)
MILISSNPAAGKSAPPSAAPRPTVGAAPARPARRAALEAAIERACARIAPLWPLRNFVAVNPFLGHTALPFATTCARFRRVLGADMLMPRAFYRQALAEGRIEDRDLLVALSTQPRTGAPRHTLATLKAALQGERAPRPAPAQLVTVEEALDGLGACAPRARDVVVDEISRWCAAYFDESQSVWRMPSRGLAPYAAWRASMRHDRNPELLGVKGFRATVAGLPESPVDTIAAVVDSLGLYSHTLEDYFHRALFDIGGWAAYARYKTWHATLDGRSDDTLVQLLAVRMAWTHALARAHAGDEFDSVWRRAVAAARPTRDDHPEDDPELALDLVLQEAYERAGQRRLIASLSPVVRVSRSVLPGDRLPLQAAFCIDVRSEVFRRALEQVCPVAQTIGFAGFFGFPIEYVPIGQTHGGAQCPVLLKPRFTVCEEVGGADEAEAEEVLGLRRLRRRASKAWKSFKGAAVSSFTYVESIGLLFAGKLVSDSLGVTRTVADPDTEGLSPAVIARKGPRIEPRELGGRASGFTREDKVVMAEAVLRGMSLTGGFARLVMLTGHGSSTVNNPHASGLDCGACGGHSGEANARVAAAILNDAEVRNALGWRGIRIPEDTWFLGCLHDTTTDEVTIFDEAAVPDSHRDDLACLRDWLARAAALARRERAPLLGVDRTAGADAAVCARSRDWSQVRPEWGLAGNAAFIAAPRSATAGTDLGGRAFLHSYDWRQDKDFGVLELIMTAPMVVASWINLQYYGSAVNNGRFGAGNKVLHNVCGGIGVLEGNAGDLRVGLPWQSVHDGERLVHEPLRLNVFIAAPIEAIDRVIAKHREVRELIDNRWLHLFAMNDAGWPSHRYLGGQRWDSLAWPA